MCVDILAPGYIVKHLPQGRHPSELVVASRAMLEAKGGVGLVCILDLGSDTESDVEGHAEANAKVTWVMYSL